MTRRALFTIFLLVSWSCSAPTPFERLQREVPVAVVAHRGASADYPENTEVAFRAAVDAGAPMVELDVYQSADGVWVCMHDRTLDRTTDVRARLGRKGVRVGELTFAQLRSLDAGSWFGAEYAGARIPTLEEALAAIAPAIPMIELKIGDPLAMVAELRRLGVVEDVLVQSFNWGWLEQVHAAEPRLLLGALSGDAPTEARLQGIARTGARVVHWGHHRLTSDAARWVLDSGRLLCVYTVDEEAEFARCMGLGCQMITTNRPGHFVRFGGAQR